MRTPIAVSLMIATLPCCGAMTDMSSDSAGGSASGNPSSGVSGASWGAGGGDASGGASRAGTGGTPGGYQVAGTGGAGGGFEQDSTEGVVRIDNPFCSDPRFPVLCRASGAVADGCWSSAVVCSTVTVCPDGSAHACGDSDMFYDCTKGRCDCRPSSDYPFYCPSSGTRPGSCWSSEVACSTIANCDGALKACKSASQRVDCAGQICAQ